ncbi:MAG: hypothetical protein MK214_15670 [Thalassotalea sp.]|nr:hypothetical protein [Thalassotalea sp.]
MKYVNFLFLLITMAASNANDEVQNLKVDGNLVTFTAGTGTSEPVLACVTEETTHLWGFSLDSASGKAMYSMLVTAIASNRGVNVSTANDCVDDSGIERAQSIELGAVFKNVTTEATSKFEIVAYGSFLGGGCYSSLNSKSENGISYLNLYTT